MATRVCAKCGKKKTLNTLNFYSNKKCPGGLENTCVVCRNEAKKKNASYGKARVTPPVDPETGGDPGAFTAHVLGYRVPQIQGARVVDMDRAGNGRRMVGWTVHE